MPQIDSFEPAKQQLVKALSDYSEQLISAANPFKGFKKKRSYTKLSMQLANYFKAELPENSINFELQKLLFVKDNLLFHSLFLENPALRKLLFDYIFSYPFSNIDEKNSFIRLMTNKINQAPKPHWWQFSKKRRLKELKNQLQSYIEELARQPEPSATAPPSYIGDGSSQSVENPLRFYGCSLSETHDYEPPASPASASSNYTQPGEAPVFTRAARAPDQARIDYFSNLLATAYQQVNYAEHLFRTAAVNDQVQQTNIYYAAKQSLEYAEFIQANDFYHGQAWDILTRSQNILQYFRMVEHPSNYRC